MTDRVAKARIRMLRAGGVLALAAGAALSGCATPGAGSTPVTSMAATPSPADRARQTAAALADEIGTDRPDDINEVAREAVERGADLVAIEELVAAELIDPFGALTTRAPAGDGTAFCFRIEYDYYGRHSADGRAIIGTTAGVRDVACDVSTASVTPPPDTRPIVVLAGNAEAVATEVLAALPADPGEASAIGTAIAARLDAPTGEREVAAQPRAVVVGADVGVAMGDADACVLVKREAGVVSRVLVPSVLLQPGEYGCAPETALLPAEALRSPH